ncbi:unnamed protein product [Notodromas monacha]|uniref:ADP-ribosylation factor-like protein 6-interacting protein 4 n=1 Tax=Notodromas monacha TaxID=399045 RepID=A0A7R9GEN5_9CRUS|nr:unnamed protein product [Notodromas monacha]CAG0918246.1 unnamed protein product [Notodromas monacha]
MKEERDADVKASSFRSHSQSLFDEDPDDKRNSSSRKRKRSSSSSPRRNESSKSKKSKKDRRSKSPKKSKKEKKKRKLKKLKKKELKELKRLIKLRNEEFARAEQNVTENEANQNGKKEDEEDDETVIGPQLPAEPPRPPLKPMTKEEWEAQQSVVRRVHDPETGRDRLVFDLRQNDGLDFIKTKRLVLFIFRLIKGDGEVIEDCVSRARHLEINKKATASDGEYFQKILASQIT